MKGRNGGKMKAWRLGAMASNRGGLQALMLGSAKPALTVLGGVLRDNPGLMYHGYRVMQREHQRLAPCGYESPDAERRAALRELGCDAQPDVAESELYRQQLTDELIAELETKARDLTEQARDLGLTVDFSAAELAAASLLADDPEFVERFEKRELRAEPGPFFALGEERL